MQILLCDPVRQREIYNKEVLAPKKLSKINQ